MKERPKISVKKEKGGKGAWTRTGKTYPRLPKHLKKM